MGVACSSQRNQSPREEIKKPITKEVVVPNGASNGTLPPKHNGNSNNKTTSESTEFTIETTRVKSTTPEQPMRAAMIEDVCKALEVDNPDVAESASLKHERGNETPRDEVAIDAGDVVKSDESRGTEHTEAESVPTQEQNENTELKVSENETNTTEEHTQSEVDQNTRVTADTEESETRGDLNISATEPDTCTGVTQDHTDSQIIENNAKALVAEVISVAQSEEQDTIKAETGETTTTE